MADDTGDLVRSAQWCGVRAGDRVVVDLDKERRRAYEFVAYVVNVRTGESWVDVRSRDQMDGRRRSFRPDVICPVIRRGRRVQPGPPLLSVPQLGLDITS